MSALDRHASDRYASVRFQSAAPLEQRLEVIDGAVLACERTAASLRARDFESGQRHAAAGRGLLMELMASLRGDAHPAFASTASRLYVYMHGQLSRAVIQNMPAAAEEVARLLRHERAAWESRRRAAAAGSAAPLATDAVA